MEEENFIQQDFLVLDFDNTILYDAFINRCKEYEIIPIFTYRTFGWSRKEERFRAVFRMDITITNIYFAKSVNGMLQQLFPEADPKCSDIPRFFLGGKKLIEVNPDACAEIEDICYALQGYMKIIKENNFARDLKRFGKSIGVKVEKSSLCIYKTDNIKKSEMSVKRIVQKNYIMVCQEDEEKNILNKEKDEKDIKTIRGYSKDDLEKISPLLYERRQRDIPHGQKFLLATSLVHIAGGEQIFMDTLKRKPCRMIK